MRSTTNELTVESSASLLGFEDLSFDALACWSKASARFFFRPMAEVKEKPTLESEELRQSSSSLKSTNEVSMVRKIRFFLSVCGLHRWSGLLFPSFLFSLLFRKKGKKAKSKRLLFSSYY